MTYSTTLDTTKYPNGEHTLSATACDAAGNCSTTSVPVMIKNDDIGLLLGIGIVLALLLISYIAFKKYDTNNRL